MLIYKPSAAAVLAGALSAYARSSHHTAFAASAAEEPTTVCSCSPTVFAFVLSLDQTCDDNDINGNSGIGDSVCFVVSRIPELPLEGEPDLHITVPDNTKEPIWTQQAAAADPVTEIVSVQFREYDPSGDELTVIYQDDTYANVSLANGDRLKFNSVSSFLDTDVPLEDQMSNPALVPGGAGLILYGKTASGATIIHRFFWMYDMNCGMENEPIKVGDKIGWVTVVRLKLVPGLHIVSLASESHDDF